MNPKPYYIDTCIWLNLFKREGDETKGKPYWKIAEEFIDGIEKSEDISIVVSTIVLKELYFKLGKEFYDKKAFFNEAKYVNIVKSTEEDVQLARKIESSSIYKIGFCDCLHIAITKRLNATLVTRDKELIAIGREYVPIDKPENLIC